MIEITNYPVSVKLGCTEKERAVYQDVFLSFRLFLRQTGKNKFSDELHSTVDYTEVMKVATVALKKHSEIKLIETIARIVGPTVLSHFKKVRTLELTIEKKSLPRDITKGAKIKIVETFKR